MLLLLLLLIAAPALLYVFLELKRKKHKEIINRLPGPKALPILGNVTQMGKTPAEILDNMFNWWHEFGMKNYRLWLGFYPNIFLTEPKSIEFVLTSNSLIEKGPLYNILHPWLGMGLLTSSGTHWHKHRKMITPTFHFKILQNFHETMNQTSSKFMQKLREASTGDTIFDFQDMVHYFTMDVICETAMGVSINAMDDNDSEVVNAFKKMAHDLNLRVFEPLKRNNKIFKFFPSYAEYKKSLKILLDFTNDVVEKRRQLLQSEAKSDTVGEEEVYSRRKTAFLDTLLNATIDGEPLSKKDICDEVSTFMFEGHDTTTSGIAFAIYILSRHPDIQKRVFAEQMEIMGDDLTRSATFQEVADMKYLDLVLRETARLYPSVPLIGRRAEKDYDMYGTLIPKNTTLTLFLMALGYNENAFPDPYRVNPERFEVENRGEKSNPFEYVPFSAGPRNCIGQKFAMLELKIVVSMIVRTFEVLPPLDKLISKDGYVETFIGLPKEEKRKRRPNPSKYDPVLSAVLTLKSNNGIHIRLRERK